MTSCATKWLTRTFRCLFDDLNRGSTLFGKPVLTWWQGTVSGITPSNLPQGASLPAGHFVIYNQHYREIMSVSAPKGFSMDEHEFLITPGGVAYFVATRVVKADLSGLSYQNTRINMSEHGIGCMAITRGPVRCRPCMVAVPGTHDHAEVRDEAMARRVPEDLPGMEEALSFARREQHLVHSGSGT